MNSELVLERLLAVLPDNQTRFTELCRSVSNCNALLEQAERHGLLGILHTTLTEFGNVLPPEVATSLRRRATLQRLRQAHDYSILDEILLELSRAGVEAVPLKGPILSERLYGDGAVRSSTDLDLLVAPNVLPSATRCLERLGYRGAQGSTAGEFARYHHHLLAFHRAQSPSVELHFRLYTGFGAVLTAEGFLARARGYTTARGLSCRVLVPEDELLFLLLHAAGHRFARLAWLYDIKMFTNVYQPLHWAAVEECARQSGVGNAVALACDILRRRLKFPCPHAHKRSDVSEIRLHLANSLLAANRRLAPESLPDKFLSLCYQAALCDRFSTMSRFLLHRCGRFARRYLPEDSSNRRSEEWAA